MFVDFLDIATFFSQLYVHDGEEEDCGYSSSGHRFLPVYAQYIRGLCKCKYCIEFPHLQCFHEKVD